MTARPTTDRLLPPAVLALAGLAPAQQQSAPAPPGPASVAGSTGAALDALVRAFDPAGGGFSGVVLVARDGRVLLEKGYGVHDAAIGKPIDASSLWDWASIGKQFTAAALL